MTAIELAYLGVEVDDVDSFGSVLSDVVGLVPGEAAGTARTWRNDSRAHRVLVEEGPANDATVLGFSLQTLADAEAVVARLASLDYAVTEASTDRCDERQVERLWECQAPWGVPVELAVGLAGSPVPFESPLVPNGFLTEGVGFGHCVFMVADLEEAHRFLIDGLGFKQTDWIEAELAPGVAINGRFYHGNPRHHTIALIAVPKAPRAALHHFMVETNNVDDVGAAFDRAFAAELPLPNGLGKHDNDQMFSFYLQTPAGFQIEVGTGARTVGEDWDENRAYDAISAWGHQPVSR